MNYKSKHYEQLCDFNRDQLLFLKTYFSSLGLTPSETCVVILVIQGLTNIRIGEILRVRDKTIKYHLCNVSSRLNIFNRYSLFWILPFKELLQLGPLTAIKEGERTEQEKVDLFKAVVLNK